MKQRIKPWYKQKTNYIGGFVLLFAGYLAFKDHPDSAIAALTIAIGLFGYREKERDCEH